jgi:hypothetical protein
MNARHNVLATAVSKPVFSGIVASASGRSCVNCRALLDEAGHDVAHEEWQNAGL